MNKEELQGRLENLRLQQKQAEATWSKIQGAIEFCESLMEDKSKENNNNGVAKKVKEKATA